MFLKHIAHDVYVCGKTINLLKLCCPRVRRVPPPAHRSTLPLALPLLSLLVMLALGSRGPNLSHPPSRPPETRPSVLGSGSAVLDQGSW